VTTKRGRPPLPPPPTTGVPCRHCQRLTSATSARGLCRVCHGSKRLRSMYTSRKPPAVFDTVCVGCGKAKRIKCASRRLCDWCFRNPVIREAHTTPETTSRAEEGYGLVPATVLSAEPTTARPGSKEKIAVLEARARDGVLLWHPEDVKGCVR